MPRVLTVSETDFQQQITELASMLGYEWVHFRPARTQYGWRTPSSGPLGAGFPDLVLVRERDGRLIFAELKRDDTATTPQQDRVLQLLARTEAEVYVWRPRDFDAIVVLLQ